MAGGEQFLAVAARIGIRIETTTYPFDDVDQALLDLAEGPGNVAAVMVT